jgi:ABC-type branched-subunit amino acid transport system permease subunit
VDWGSIFENTLQALFSANAIIYAVIAIGLNVHFGYTGLLNFGQVGFVALGAYGMAISVTYYDWSMWVGIGVGLVLAVVLALLLGIPTLRLRADYLAITTIAASEIIRLVVNAPDLREFTGGVDGLSGFTATFQRLNPFESGVTYGFGPLTYRGNALWFILCGWTTVAVVTFVVWLLMRSPWGRVVKAIREDEDAVRALGKNAYVYKLQALIIGGVIGGIGGILLALSKGSITPQDFQPQVTFIAYAVLILGGLARIFGPIVGSMILWGILAFTSSFLRDATTGADPLIPDSIIESGDVGVVRLMLVGLLLVLLMAFRPQGMFGKREEMALDDS